MSPLSPSQRRGLRMAAQVACVASLVAAAAGTSHARASAGAGTDDGTKLSTVERTEDVLRLRGQGGGCFQPVTWGPPAPAALTERDLAAWTNALAEAA